MITGTVIIIAAWFGFLVNKYTPKDIAHITVHGKPTWKSYLRTFGMLAMGQINELKLEKGTAPFSAPAFGRQVAASARKEVKAPSFSEKRKSGITSSRGGIKVKGGLLPKQTSIGTIQVYYDGSPPKYKGSKGKIRQYTSSGNMQIFYRKPEDSQNIEFLGEIVDVYEEY